MEVLDLYAKNGEPLGRTCIRGTRLQPGEYQLISIALILNEQNELLLTKRSRHKILPGFWECTGGAVMAGESSRAAIVREIREEIGIELELPDREPLHRFSEANALFDVWRLRTRIRIEETSLQESEVEDIGYFKKTEVLDMIRKGETLPNLRFIHELLERGQVELA